MPTPPNLHLDLFHLPADSEGPRVPGEPNINDRDRTRRAWITCLCCRGCGADAEEGVDAMTLAELITIADHAYGDGLVGQYVDEPDANHGDTLAKSIALELAETFEPDLPRKTQIAEAIRVMTSAMRQLEDVVAAFEAAQC